MSILLLYSKHLSQCAIFEKLLSLQSSRVMVDNAAVQLPFIDSNNLLWTIKFSQFFRPFINKNSHSVF